MVHRALYGSVERFFGILLEHYAGAFPVWLSPVQAIVLPIADRHVEYAKKAVNALESAGIRVDLDARSEKVNYKIREAQLQKIPHMLVIGDREAEQGTVSLRNRKQGDLGAIRLEDCVARILNLTESKSIEE
jgi:threonyl-tRNA synthetase